MAVDSVCVLVEKLYSRIYAAYVPLAEQVQLSPLNLKHYMMRFTNV